MIHEHRFDHREALYRQVYDEMVGCIAADLRERDAATLLLSGGSSPVPVYQRLATADLDWDKVRVALVDERWVEPDHEASNERLLRQHLLQHRAARSALTAMKTADSTPQAGEEECNACYATLLMPYTVCVLGMGSDGHAASLFPHASGLPAALQSQQLCAAINATPSPATGDHVQRMTMTPWAILQAKTVMLLITGEDKWQVYQRAKAPGAVAEMPVRAFLQQQTVDIHVYWAP